MTIDKQALRKVAEKAQAARARLESFPDEDGVLFEDDDIKSDVSACNKFFVLATPATMLALLDELDSTNGYASAYEAEKWHYHGLAESEGERADRAEKHVAELESIATDYGLKFQKTQDALKHQMLLHKSQMEAAEKRIAELEARTVTSPKNNVANVGDSRWMWYQRDLMWIEAIRAAGIRIKGE